METKIFAVRLCRRSTKSGLTLVTRAIHEEDAYKKAIDEFPDWVVLSATIVYNNPPKVE